MSRITQNSFNASVETLTRIDAIARIIVENIIRFYTNKRFFKSKKRMFFQKI